MRPCHIQTQLHSNLHVYFAEKKASYYFTQKLSKKMIGKRKTDVLLETMISDPRPPVKWFRNGEPVEVSHPTASSS